MNQPSPRKRLIEAALSHAHFDGMNWAALKAGAADIGMSQDAMRVYVPGGGAELAAAYHRRADDALRHWLTASPPEGRFRDRIADSVWQRLSFVEPGLVRAGAAVFALPAHSALGARLIWETADIIWTGLGDGSDDVNWYTKRATLAAVIGATSLFWLGDHSDDYHMTREFLDRRVDDVMQIEKAKANLRQIPGLSELTALATGWIQAPHDRNLPGKTKNSQDQPCFQIR